jgi:hypothetical protein
VIAQRVVARWSHCDESDGVIVPVHLGDHRQSGTGGELRDPPGIVRGVRVGIEISASLVTEVANSIEVLRIVNASEFGSRRTVRCRVHKILIEMKIVHSSECRVETLRPLGMTWLFVSRVTDRRIQYQHRRAFWIE